MRYNNEMFTHIKAFVAKWFILALLCAAWFHVFYSAICAGASGNVAAAVAVLPLAMLLCVAMITSELRVVRSDEDEDEDAAPVVVKLDDAQVERIIRTFGPKGPILMNLDGSRPRT